MPVRITDFGEIRSGRRAPIQALPSEASPSRPVSPMYESGDIYFHRPLKQKGTVFRVHRYRTPLPALPTRTLLLLAADALSAAELTPLFRALFLSPTLIE
jgi:hypothetical protein